MTTALPLKRLPSPYRALLDAAYRTGEADGVVAAQLRLTEEPPAIAGRFHGRDAARFAEWLWHPRCGPAPSGLTTNAGLWYLAGYRHGLGADRTVCFTDQAPTVTAEMKQSPTTETFSAPSMCTVSDIHSGGIRPHADAGDPSISAPSGSGAADRSGHLR